MLYCVIENFYSTVIKLGAHQAVAGTHLVS